MSIMDISVTSFKQRCLELVRRVEKTGTRVTITRRGRVVAQLDAVPPAGAAAGTTPWERLRALGGRLRATPGESVVRDEDFEALR
jgi:antitoxin (DNA-binding transcriptional repressor) of toxin-antitoxin stability system